MDKLTAWRTRPKILHEVLTRDEIASLDALYQTIRAEEAQVAGNSEFFQHPNLCGTRNGKHVTAYLHCANRIDNELPELLNKVVKRMQDSDSWGLLSGKHNLRVCEYHEYFEGGSLCDPMHCDGGSLLTISVMLAAPTEFTGGEFTMLEEDDTISEYNLQQGDGILFVSEKYHSVEVVESGKRRSFVIELWDGPRCSDSRSL